MIKELSFNFQDTTYTANLWDKVPTDHRWYIKYNKKDGEVIEYAVFYVQKNQMTRAKLKAWPSSTFREGFEEAFDEALTQAFIDSRALEPVALDVVGIEKMAPDTQPIQAEVIEIHTKDDPFIVGTVLRNPDNHEQVLYVLSMEKQYVREDGHMYELSGESGWLHWGKCRLATDEEIAKLEADEARRAENRRLEQERNDRIYKNWRDA